jgi:hypothetical protein
VFTATPSAIASSSPSTLAWTVSGAGSLKIDQGIGSVTGTSVAVMPQATTIYTLTASNAGGSTSATATVRVGAAPVIASFAATPSWVTIGNSSALNWSVTGATSLNIDKIGAVTATGVPITPSADTDYLLTATNEFGSAQATASIAIFQPPKTWFAPLGNIVSPDYGSVDYTTLFSSTSPWSMAASHIQVFKLYAVMLTLPDADLMNLFAELKRRHIAVALEWGPLVPGTCGNGVEGFDGSEGRRWAQRIHDMGGSLQYLAFDEPFFYGAMYSGASACHWTPDQVAQDAAAHTADIRSIFPDVVVGDIEVVPAAFVASDWLERYQAWIDAWQKATGTPLAFFDFDTDMNSDWRPGVEALARILRQLQIPFGMIYTGGAEATDADWVNGVEAHFTNYENRGSPIADQIIFQSWQAFPKHLLPESDPTTFTHLIDRYFRNRTTLAAAVSGSSAQGSLTITGSGAPLANAPIAVTASPLTGSGQPTAYVRTGTVPTGTQFITFGVRVNTECAWSGPADFYITNFVMDAGTAGTIGADFVNQLADWGSWGLADTLQVSSATLHIATSLGESLGMNHYPVAFNGAGAPFTLTVSAMIPTGSLGNGCAIMVFQNSSQTELGRVSIPLQPQPVSLGTAQTFTDGSFALTLGSVPPGAFELWADYPGSDTLWPASNGVAMGGVPVAITTASLPTGTLGTAYSQALAAAGGRSPYLWVATGVPPGLTFSSTGALAGTPTVAGTYTVMITAIDDSVPTQTAQQAFNLSIR